MGPLEVWQLYAWFIPSFTSPHRRLDLAGRWGLPVGRGSRVRGGLSTYVAVRYEKAGIVKLTRDRQGRIVRAHACQLSFEFEGGPEIYTTNNFTTMGGPS